MHIRSWYRLCFVAFRFLYFYANSHRQSEYTRRVYIHDAEFPGGIGLNGRDLGVRRQRLEPEPQGLVIVRGQTLEFDGELAKRVLDLEVSRGADDGPQLFVPFVVGLALSDHPVLAVEQLDGDGIRLAIIGHAV